MGDSTTRSAQHIHRNGSAGQKAAVSRAFTKSGTVKSGASKATVAAARKVISTHRNRKLAGRTRRQAPAKTAAINRASPIFSSKARLRGE